MVFVVLLYLLGDEPAEAARHALELGSSLDYNACDELLAVQLVQLPVIHTGLHKLNFLTLASARVLLTLPNAC